MNTNLNRKDETIKKMRKELLEIKKFKTTKEYRHQYYEDFLKENFGAEGFYTKLKKSV